MSAPAESQPCMSDDQSNPVIAWCVHGMQREGTPHEARASYERAWTMRRDDHDACIAAHFLARVQSTPEETLVWNRRAVAHALAAPEAQVARFLASLHLNLGDSWLAMGALPEASAEVARARAALAVLAPDGYARFVALGVARLEARLQLPRDGRRDAPGARGA